MNMEKKWILLIEDEKAFAELLMEELSKVADFKMLWAKTLPDGLNKLNNQKFSCVLLDLLLEKHSGLKLIQQVRNPNATKQLNSKTPIILMSGYLKGDVVVSVASLVQGIIAKPFKPTDVIQKIRDAIDAEEAPETTVEPSPALDLQAFKTPPAGVTPERTSKFIHDLNNVLAIVSMSMDRLSKQLTEINATRELENVAKLDGHIKRIIDLVKDFRAETKKNAS